MAMTLPVVCSPLGFEGIQATPERDLVVAKDTAEWVDILVNILSSNTSETLGKSARQCVCGDNYRWQTNLKQLKHYLDDLGSND